jgi:hypothetical protein
MYCAMMILLRNRRVMLGDGFRLSPFANYEMLKPSLLRTAFTQ